MGLGRSLATKYECAEMKIQQNVNVTKYKMAKNKWNKCKKTKYKIQTWKNENGTK